MTITRNFKLYLNAGTASAPYINVNQYDEGEEWVFTLYNEDGSTYTPSTGAIIGIKSDGNAIMNSGSVVGGKVVITETQQMTAASGRAIYELLIDNATHGTANFIVNVERRPSDDAEFSDSDLSMLQEAIDAAEVINEILDEGGDPSEIIEENVNAWLDNHPEATTTVQDGAITAPKINSTLWDKLLVSEEASGAVASFDDGADDVPVSSLKVALEPVQLGSGDPSPSNIRPIVASNGKNLLPPSTTQTSNGVKFTVNADGTITATRIASSTNNAEYDLTVPSSLYGKTVILNGCPSGGSDGGTYRMFFLVNGSRQATDYGNGVTYTIPSSSTSCVVRINVFKDFNSTATFKPMIRLSSITDASYQPYQGIMVERTGRNLIPMTIMSGSYANGVTVTVNDDKSFIITKTSTSGWTSFNLGTFMLDAGTYTLIESDDSSTNASISIYNASAATEIGNTRYAKTRTITLTEATTVYATFARASSADNVLTKLMLFKGEAQATDYEPYTGTSYPYTLGREVYGGSVDLATGVLTVDMGYFTLNGSETWTVENNGARVVTNALQGRIKPNTGNDSTVEGDITNMFLQTTPNMTFVGNTGFAVTRSGNVHVSDGSGSMTVAGWKSFLASNPLTLAMKLATPTTVQLTPTEVKTLLGYNNISSTGTVDVIYHADTKLYIDKKIGELS